MTRTTAENTGSGRLVYAEINGQPVVSLKTVRLGKDFINHYVIPLEPRPEGPLHLVYLDYEDTVEDCHSQFQLRTGEAIDHQVPNVGEILINPRGAFLKVQEHLKDVTMFAYVHLDSGEIRRHQERDISGVFGWHVTREG